MSSESESDAGEFHEMREPDIEKVVVHMGIGRGGEPLAEAEDILGEITGQQPVRTTAERTIQDFNVREGDPIGAKVTLRGENAEAFLGTALPLAALVVVLTGGLLGYAVHRYEQVRLGVVRDE